MVGVFEEA